MDKILVRNWNSRVKTEDTVFHLGDFAFRNRLGYSWYDKVLNGKLILLQGNHDPHKQVKTIIQNVVIEIGGKQFLLIHDPSDANWNGIVLCGHVHENWKFEHFENREFEINFDAINVGVDVWNFRPISIEEILREYEQWKSSYMRG